MTRHLGDIGLHTRIVTRRKIHWFQKKTLEKETVRTRCTTKTNEDIAEKPFLVFLRYLWCLLKDFNIFHYPSQKLEVGFRAQTGHFVLYLLLSITISMCISLTNLIDICQENIWVISFELLMCFCPPQPGIYNMSVYIWGGPTKVKPTYIFVCKIWIKFEWIDKIQLILVNAITVHSHTLESIKI